MTDMPGREPEDLDALLVRLMKEEFGLEPPEDNEILGPDTQEPIPMAIKKSPVQDG